MRYIELKTYQYFHKTYYKTVDYFFDSLTMHSYLSRLNYAGGKSLNHRLFYRTLYFFKAEGYHPVDYFYSPLGKNILNMKTVHILIFGRSQHIPVPIVSSEGFSIVIRYLLRGARAQPADTFEQRLLMEFEGIIYSIYHSYARDALDKLFQQAKENRIYMHYRWH